MPGVIRRGAKAALAARSTRSLWKTLRVSTSVCVLTSLCVCLCVFPFLAAEDSVLGRSTLGSAEGQDGLSEWSRTAGSRVRTHHCIKWSRRTTQADREMDVSHFISSFPLKSSFSP